MPLTVKLVVVGGDVKTTELKLSLPSTIGRGRGAGIVLPHPLVSRQHCELFEADGQLMVRDLGSLNGTFINNEKVTESPLPPGELLTVGTVTFRAVYETENAPSAATKKSKPGTSDKTIPATKATTLAAAEKHATPAAADSDSGVLEFNFEQPLLPGDVDEAEPAGAGGAHPTERLQETVSTTRPKQAAEPVVPKKTDKQPASAPKSKPEEVAVRSSDEDSEDGDSSASDGDLDDFLKSLGSG
jgi:predicted component of type VI protein secretion system